MRTRDQGGHFCAAALLSAVAWLLQGAAFGQDLPPISDRDYAIDLYQGAVLGSADIVGMGGASVAIASGSAGILVNPASVAVWPATSTGSWDWDFHFDYLNQLPGEDLDNNGIPDPDVELSSSPYITAGIAGRWKVFAIGATVSSSSTASPSLDGSDNTLVSSTNVIRVAGGVNLAGETLALGAALVLGTFDVTQEAPMSGAQNRLFDIGGSGFELGATWAPRKQNYRLGASLRSPINDARTVELGDDSCDPLDCQGYILPERVTGPYEVAIGGAWRFGPSRWNQKVGATWRDERYLKLAADAVIIGPSEDGHGVGAFAQGLLQRSGRDTKVSVRVGAEFEWIPGWLRLRAGSYYEPSRFEGVSGRVHFTGGLEARIWSLCFWESRYRLMVGLTGDGADGYGNGGATIGFWH